MDNNDWLASELQRIAGMAEVFHTPELKQLQAACEARQFPQDIRDLKSGSAA